MLTGTGDFNGDNRPDYVLYNSGTHQTAIWHLNNNAYIGGGFGPTLPNGWALVGVGILIAPATQIMSYSMPVQATQPSGIYREERLLVAPGDQPFPAAGHW